MVKTEFTYQSKHKSNPKLEQSTQLWNNANTNQTQNWKPNSLTKKKQKKDTRRRIRLKENPPVAADSIDAPLPPSDLRFALISFLLGELPKDRDWVFFRGHRSSDRDGDREVEREREKVRRRSSRDGDRERSSRGRVATGYLNPSKASFKCVDRGTMCDAAVGNDAVDTIVFFLQFQWLPAIENVNRETGKNCQKKYFLPNVMVYLSKMSIRDKIVHF
ncbi:hypothetical protein LXL04_032363 [Taraxacum kok-saghyz]